MVLKKLKPNMIVYDVRKNNRISFEKHSKWSVYPVQILEIDKEKERVYAKWNVLNEARWYSKNTWSKWRINNPNQK